MYFCYFHFENTALGAVNDLICAAFKAALKRFTVRRGKHSDIFNDNDRNVAVAHNELRTIRKCLCELKGEKKLKLI